VRVVEDEPASVRAIRRRGRFAAALTFFGPAFVASVAYVDPGNFATNFSAGAQHGYELAWVIVMASVMGAFVQYLTSKVGLAANRSLPELCRARFVPNLNRVLWLQAEVVAIATDLAEVVGAAVGLHLVFGVPLFLGGLITAVVSFSILALERRGYRPFELAIVALLLLLAAGFAYLFVAVSGENTANLANGLIPRLSGGDALSLSVGIIGATVMPHVVYLHSALQKDRIRANTPSERRTLLVYNRWDCIVGLGLAGAVNLGMLCVAATVFRKSGLKGVNDLIVVHARLESVVGGGAALAFGIALMVSGFSSSSVGTYAGQVVMAGFIDRRIPVVVRRAVTILPSLVVLAVVANTGQILILSQIVLSFGIPFALVPLLLVARDVSVMGDMVNRGETTLIAGIVIAIITGLNLYLLFEALRSVF
jgi:manganese transport protein